MGQREWSTAWSLGRCATAATSPQQPINYSWQGARTTNEHWTSPSKSMHALGGSRRLETRSARLLCFAALLCCSVFLFPTSSIRLSTFDSPDFFLLSHPPPISYMIALLNIVETISPFFLHLLNPWNNLDDCHRRPVLLVLLVLLDVIKDIHPWQTGAVSAHHGGCRAIVHHRCW